MTYIFSRRHSSHSAMLSSMAITSLHICGSAHGIMSLNAYPTNRSLNFNVTNILNCPFELEVYFLLSEPVSTFIHCKRKQRRLWLDCMSVQALLGIHCAPMR